MRTSLLFLFLILLFFSKLGDHGLFEPDEGRYAEIPREMIESGDFVTPRLDYVKYFEKPVLSYWLTAAAFKVFGYTAFAARFFNALLAVGGVAVTWLLAKKTWGRDAADWSALILGTSLLYLAIGQILLTDMPLSFFLTATFAAAWYAVNDERSVAPKIIFYAGMAFGLLSKGLVAIVLPVGVLLCFSVATRSLRPLKVFLSLSGVAAFCVIGVPWFWLVCRRNPDFFYFFFIHEHFLRYATKIHDRYQPMWFFIPIMFAAFLPWLGLWPSALADGARGAWSAFRTRWPRCGDDSFALYLVVWCAAIVGFFSLSDSKLIPYVVPAMPPVAILMGRAVAARIEEGSRMGVMRWSGAISAGLLAVGFAVLPFVFKDARYDAKLVAWTSWIIAATLFAIALSWLCLARASLTKHLAPALLICTTAFGLAVGDLTHVVAERKSVASIVPALEKIVAPDDIVANYNDYMQALPFYLRRRVMIVNWKGELAFGIEAEPEVAKGWFVDDGAFEKIWDGDRRVVLVVEKRRMESLPDFVKKNMTIEAESRNFAAVTNGATSGRKD